MVKFGMDQDDGQKTDEFVEEINQRLLKFKKESKKIIIITVIASILSFGILLPIAAIICIIAIMNKYSKLYDKNMENDFINTVIKGISSDLIFEQSGFIQKKYFAESNLIFDKYSGNNLIYGMVDNTKIQLSNLFISRTQRRYDVQRDMDFNEDITLFSGVFAIVDLEDNCDIDVRLTQNKGNDEGFIKHLFVKDVQRVKLENIDFERLFNVYSDDPIKARKMIDFGFMERMIALKNKYSGIEVHYYKNKIYVILPTYLGLNSVKNKDMGKNGKVDKEFVLKNITKTKEIIMDITSLKTGMINR